MAEVQARILENPQRARAEGGQSSSPLPRQKPHFDWLGLRYDPMGRLWVKTGRGDESRTVFDVFAVSGSYLGEVVVAGAISSFSLGGDYLVTAGENEEGVPQVSLWTVGR
jgi:hypothetical protein